MNWWRKQSHKNTYCGASRSNEDRGQCELFCHINYCDYGFQITQIISKWKEVNVSGDVKNSKLQNSGDCQNIESAENTKKTFFFQASDNLRLGRTTIQQYHI